MSLLYDLITGACVAIARLIELPCHVDTNMLLMLLDYRVYLDRIPLLWDYNFVSETSTSTLKRVHVYLFLSLIL